MPPPGVAEAILGLGSTEAAVGIGQGIEAEEILRGRNFSRWVWWQQQQPPRAVVQVDDGAHPAFIPSEETPEACPCVGSAFIRRGIRG